jgi:ribosome biogenesis GTPase / thiamine phosphate phosphatase
MADWVAGEVWEGRVVRAQSGFFVVETEHGRVTAVLRGRLRRDRQSAGLAALGDRVRVELIQRAAGDAGLLEGVILDVLPRDAVLARRAPGSKGVWAQDVVVANIDLLVPVFAARNPAPKPRMLDRFLALAEIDHVSSLIVLNKIDLGVPPEVEAALAEYERIGYPVIRASTKTGAGIVELRQALTGRVSAVVGPSGAGKSSLLNVVEPGLALAVGEVSDAVHKGRHTTRVGELHTLSDGGMVADTPGLREIALWEVDPGELEFAFVEFQPFLHDCRYYDCTHTHEPGCAVRAAVETGAVSVERYESYVRLLKGED